MKVEHIEPYADVIINLYKGIISVDDGKVWRLLVEYEPAIQHYLEKTGLYLHVNHSDGYAYLEQPETDDDGFETNVSRLTRRMPISPIQTIVLIVLRQKLLDFESNVQEQEWCIITREEILEECSPFLENSADEKRSYRALDKAINKVKDYGFIKPLKPRNNDVFIIQKVLKSKLNSQMLSELKDKLQARYTQMNRTNDDN